MYHGPKKIDAGEFETVANEELKEAICGEAIIVRVMNSIIFTH